MQFDDEEEEECYKREIMDELQAPDPEENLLQNNGLDGVVAEKTFRAWCCCHKVNLVVSDFVDEVPAIKDLRRVRRVSKTRLIVYFSAYLRLSVASPDQRTPAENCVI